MKTFSPPFHMDSLRIVHGGNTVDIPFVPEVGTPSETHIQWTTLRTADGQTLSVKADASFFEGDEATEHRARLDLSLVKNGEPFRVICNGGLLLCDEVDKDKSFWIQFGAWE